MHRKQRSLNRETRWKFREKRLVGVGEGTARKRKSSLRDRIPSAPAFSREHSVFVVPTNRNST
jgi:hypothetical protein